MHNAINELFQYLKMPARNIFQMAIVWSYKTDYLKKNPNAFQCNTNYFLMLLIATHL